MAKLLQDRGVAATVYGVDVEESAIKWANELTREERSLALEFRVGDIGSGVDLISDKPGVVVVLMREVIEHLPEGDIDEILRHAREAVPRAKVMISVPSVNSPTEEKHFRHYTESSLRETLDRNGYRTVALTGFGFRPAALYWFLKRTKALLNRRPRFWWLLNPLWRAVKPEWAITLVAMADTRPAE
jgi:xanthine/CO dehydrogenase XdhC/CoxF family maturation factor